jgi:hypothetical protein
MSNHSDRESSFTIEELRKDDPRLKSLLEVPEVVVP